MITVCDKFIWESFGPSWIEAVERAGIQYWVVVALDVETSIAVAKYKVDHCFESPMIANETLSAIHYHWGSDHWKKRTWDKVRVIDAIYSYGFHVIHSDTDTSWFRDPLPFFEAHRNEPYDIMISTDLTITFNPINVTDVEFATDPHMNINTGIYLLRQTSSGKSLLRGWLDVIELNPAVGHDQDGFNSLVRGDYFRGDKKYGRARKIPSAPYFSSAFNSSIFVSLLPSSSFANTYTFCNAASYKRLGHDLYAVHWVWGSRTKESKIQNIRDIGKFLDRPEYYRPRRLLSFDLDHLKMPKGFNQLADSEAEDMIRFHLKSTLYQLHQFYAAAAIAISLDRVLILPKFLCYCSKNWYKTMACRINEPQNAEFPFVCPLSQIIRVQNIQNGFIISNWSYPSPSFPRGESEGEPDLSESKSSNSNGTTVSSMEDVIFTRNFSVREYSFLENVHVDKSYREDRIEIEVDASTIDALRAIGVIAPLNVSLYNSSFPTRNSDFKSFEHLRKFRKRRWTRRQRNKKGRAKESKMVKANDEGENNARDDEGAVEVERGSEHERGNERKRGNEHERRRTLASNDNDTLADESPILPVFKPPITSSSSRVVFSSLPLTDVQLAQAFRPIASRKLLHLKNPRAMFQGFQDPGIEMQFDAAMRNVSSKWCCRRFNSFELTGLPREEPLPIVPVLMPYMGYGLQGWRQGGRGREKREMREGARKKRF
eukprot:CAMPEP_0175042644 /NCGR_PEP_ID=MMETSP0052_2-20121109/2695_1 /TAXON_ID=51329 ORGANISM="Polytomella parva, Strain SAG 63-3" /NCGR_SAMPLE_ID=MMETSP0052_2 /ASSEMBLY_ACC=CAM_ASM_000194 /LENGTH=713 /DNA_ID=CAMNT_0016305513 /DNA_START=462 /DNA_END=2603 /DNA_ORIENTATION=-